MKKILLLSLLLPLASFNLQAADDGSWGWVKTGLKCTAAAAGLVVAYSMGQSRERRKAKVHDTILDRFEEFRQATPSGGLLLRLQNLTSGPTITGAYPLAEVELHKKNSGEHCNGKHVPPLGISDLMQLRPSQP